MGCETSISRLEPGSRFYITTSVPAIDELYEKADEAMHAFHADCGAMLIALDTFQTAAGGGKGEGTMAKAVTATLIATIADLETSGLPTMPCEKLPGLQVAQHALHHDESRRAWTLWSSLSQELVLMAGLISSYFEDANYCAGLPKRVEDCVHRISTHSEIRVIDLRKLTTVLAFNTTALVEAAGEFHTAIYRIKARTLEAIAVLELLQKPAKLKRLRDLGSASAKIQAFDPLLVLEHFESGIRDFLSDTPKTRGTKH